MTTSPIRVLDTGTRHPGTAPEPLLVMHQPALVRLPLDLSPDDFEPLGQRPHHILFYSPFAVDTVHQSGLLPRDLPHQFWAVGSKTAEQIHRCFQQDARVPATQDFEHLCELLESKGEARDLIAFGLLHTHRDLSSVARKWSVAFREVPVYQSHPTPPETLREAFESFQPRWITLTSSRGVEAIVEALGVSELHRRWRQQDLFFAAIGSSTEQTLLEFGLHARLIPDLPDRTALLEGIKNLESTSAKRNTSL